MAAAVRARAADRRSDHLGRPAQLENVGETQLSTIDWFSVVVAALGFGGLVYGLSRFSEGVSLGPVADRRWPAPSLIAVFVARQLWLQRAARR